MGSNSSSDAAGPNVSRRIVLTRILAGGACLFGSGTGAGQALLQPAVSSFDFSLLNDWTTPNQFFFIREHFPPPKTLPADWRLQIGGAVENPFEISLKEIVDAPPIELPVTLECAENAVGGGLVSHAVWKGVSLAGLLNRAKPLSEGRFILLTGEDTYVRSLPLSKARHKDTLLAYEMNREKLPLVHGGPLRALIPGWYGMDSVKWLRRINVVADSTNESYVRRTRSGAGAPVAQMRVKSAFARPLEGAVLFGRRLVVRGAAWAGERTVRRVEVSVNAGSSWQEAVLLDDPQAYAWIRWQYDWKIARPGRYTLAVRASDDGGRTQPSQRDPDRLDSYEQDACQRIDVTVV